MTFEEWWRKERKTFAHSREWLAGEAIARKAWDAALREEGDDESCSYFNSNIDCEGDGHYQCKACTCKKG